MRQTVKRPGPSLKRQIRAQGQLQVPDGAAIIKKATEKRLRLAKRVPKNQLIRHFSPTESTAYKAPAAPLLTGSKLDGIARRPQSSSKTGRPQTTADLLERALNQATSHQQKPPKRPRSHLKKQIGILASVALAVGVLTVIASQNISGAQLQMASAKAGFTAKLPDYKPSGFSQSSLDSASGIIATQFHSNSDDRSYTITQKASGWDSADLLANFVEKTDPNYTTVTANGLIIYLYGNHNATWVNGGIWYTVLSSGALSDHQLAELAASL